MRPLLKLRDAFISLQPIGHRTPVRERTRLQEAGRVMLDAINERARAVMPPGKYSDSDRDTAVQTVLFRLIKAGPRGPRAGDPSSDEGVARWLSRAIRNAMNDQHRRQKRHVQIDDRVMDKRAHAAHRGGSGGARRVSERRITDAIAEARARLFSEIIPAVQKRKAGASKAAALRFVANVETLTSAVRSGQTVVHVATTELRAEGVDETDAKRWRKSLNTRRTALDKRFQRVREHVIEEIERRREAGLLDRRQRAVLLLLVQQAMYLQRRTDAVITRAHRDLPSGGHS